jgi:hypothetical protein
VDGIASGGGALTVFFLAIFGADGEDLATHVPLIYNPLTCHEKSLLE